jgi:hypothetical protein
VSLGDSVGRFTTSENLHLFFEPINLNDPSDTQISCFHHIALSFFVFTVLSSWHSCYRENPITSGDGWLVLESRYVDSVFGRPDDNNEREVKTDREDELSRGMGALGRDTRSPTDASRRKAKLCSRLCLYEQVLALGEHRNRIAVKVDHNYLHNNF